MGQKTTDEVIEVLAEDLLQGIRWHSRYVDDLRGGTPAASPEEVDEALRLLERSGAVQISGGVVAMAPAQQELFA